MHHNATHGLSGTSLHNIWCSMRQRCSNPGSEFYAYYGGRGIIVCERWDDFAVFAADMGERPSPQHSLERKDNDKNYEPSNCRWATMKEQCRNRGNNVVYTYRGQTQCLAAWAEQTGLKYATLYMALRRGKSFENAIDPARRRRSPRSVK